MSSRTKMLKRVKHGKTGCFGKFLSRDNFNLFKKCLKLTLNCQKTEVFVVFDAISVQFPRDFVPIQSTQQQKKNELCITVFEEKVEAFCEKYTSEGLRSGRKHLRFCATCVLFESFWSQSVGKRSTKIELIIQ